MQIGMQKKQITHFTQKGSIYPTVATMTVANDRKLEKENDNSGTEVHLSL